MKPWSLGAKDSWTLTDWFENIYARTAGVDKYNQLFSGEILDFTDPTVKNALKMMTDLLNDKTVSGGIDGALGTGFVDGIGKVFSANPSAHMYMEGGFVGGIALADVNPNLKPGETIDFFPFPKIDEAQGDPLVGGGDITAAFVNNEDVAKLVEYLASPDAGEDLGLHRRDRLAEQGRDGRRLPERARQEGGRAGRERADVRVRRLRPPAGRPRRGLGHAAPERAEGPEQDRLRAGDVPAAGTGRVRRLRKVGNANQ